MMGGAVSSGESNDDLIDNLRGADYIKTPAVEKVFRAVDRAFYYTKPHKQNAYKDMAWKDGNLHLSAPCIYSEVMENLQLKPGMSFLNIGSGTGYLSTMAGLILGRKGSNHGIELHEDVTNYARAKLQVFLKSSSAVDMFDFAEPKFTVGNCLETMPSPRRYDRIYCGAACETGDLEVIIDLLKLGGICVVPMNDSLMRMTRVSESRVEMKTLLPVSFTTLVPSKNAGNKTVQLPEWNLPKLAELCRAEIRGILRDNLTTNAASTATEGDDDSRKKRRKKRNDRRRSNRLVLVQQRRNRETGSNGLATHSGSSQNSSEDDLENDRTWSRKTPTQVNSAPATASGQGGPSSVQVQEIDSSTASNLDATKDTNETLSNGHALEGNEDCVSEQQLRKTRSEMILGRIRELVRNRQIVREALQLSQAERANQIRLEVDQALREPPEGEGNPDVLMEEEGAAGNLVNDDDEIDHECVWTSNDDSSSSSTSSSSTSSSSTGNGHVDIPEAEERRDYIEVNPGRADIEESSNDVDSDSRHSPILGISFPALINPISGEENSGLSNAQIETECMESESIPETPPVFLPFSFQMMERIELLPLPPAIKKYLNYHRNLVRDVAP